MKQIYVVLTITQPLLGTVPKDRAVYATHIQSKAAELSPEDAEAELETIEEVEERGWTGFHTDGDGNPLIYNYLIKGFFKGACGMLRRAPGTLSNDVRAYKKIIDGLIFIEPRTIPIILPEGAGLEVNERPLRASTPQGERVTLVRSDQAPVGSRLEFSINLLDEKLEPLLMEWLDYGQLHGLGQWRNAGWGTFTYEVVEG